MSPPKEAKNPPHGFVGSPTRAPPCEPPSFRARGNESGASPGMKERHPLGTKEGPPRGKSLAVSDASQSEESEDGWLDPFNRWVVLESETLQEARKTDQLAFLELEAIKVRALAAWHRWWDGGGRAWDFYRSFLDLCVPWRAARGAL